MESPWSRSASSSDANVSLPASEQGWAVETAPGAQRRIAAALQADFLAVGVRELHDGTDAGGRERSVVTVTRTWATPGYVPGEIVGGWQIGMFSRLQSGTPVMENWTTTGEGITVTEIIAGMCDTLAALGVGRERRVEVGDVDLPGLERVRGGDRIREHEELDLVEDVGLGIAVESESPPVERLPEALSPDIDELLPARGLLAL